MFKMLGIGIALIIFCVASFFFGDIVASTATALGVLVAAWQIWEGRRLASAEFEDSFDQQYRAIAYEIPFHALIGKSLGKDRQEEAREGIYNYLDLCNEQVYHRTKNRISSERWLEWASGIEENLDRRLFKEVWDEVKASAGGSLSFLERIEREKFKTDPLEWK